MFLLIACGAPCACGEEGAVLQAGVAKRVVTPPLWVPYLTSSGNGTHATFQGKHDDLHARALVCDDGHQAVAMLAVDSIGYDNALLGPGRNFIAELRRRIGARTGLKPGSILLAASHTHSAPETIGLTPFRDVPNVPQWIDEHLDALVATVVAAWENRVPVRVRLEQTRVEQLGRYRRIVLKGGKLSRNGPLPSPDQVLEPWALDEDLTVVSFETIAGKPHAVLLNYTAHPVISMLLPQVSADYPGVATSAIEAALPGAICLFTQGAAGNVNSLHVSTNFEDVEAAGNRLAEAALGAIERAKHRPPLEIDRIDATSAICHLDARPAPGLAEAERRATAEPSALNKRLLRLSQKLSQGPLDAEVQAMRLGPITWISLPGEPFVETGLALKRAGATFVVGYANGYLGYFPIRRAYAEGGYECEPGTWSRVARGSAERLQAAGEDLLKRLTPGRR